MLHIAPERVEAGSEKRMSAIAQLDELIESVRKNVEKLRGAHDQAVDLAEQMKSRLAASTNLLDVLIRARTQVEQHGDLALEAVASEFDRLREIFVEKPASPPPVGVKREGLPSPADVVSMARVTLLKTGRPLKRGQLVKALEADGAVLAGADKNKNLGTILWRHPRDFVTVEGEGYWVKGVALEGVYEPERDDEPLPKTTTVRRRSS